MSMSSRKIWKTSSYSGNNGACVEVSLTGVPVVGVRDSKDRSGPELAFGGNEWSRFVGAVKSGAIR